MTDQPPPPSPEAAVSPPILPPQPPAGEWTAPPATKPPSKVRTYLIGAVVVVLIAVGAYFISQNQRADDLVIGQCFDEPGSSVDIQTVVKHACTDAHDAEVFHVVEYDEGNTYPISISLDSFIEENCVPAFGTYVGESYADSVEFSLGYFYPDEIAWGKGDRTFTCYISREDHAKLTQSVKGAGTD